MKIHYHEYLSPHQNLCHYRHSVHDALCRAMTGMATGVMTWAMTGIVTGAMTEIVTGVMTGMVTGIVTGVMTGMVTEMAQKENCSEHKTSSLSECVYI